MNREVNSEKSVIKLCQFEEFETTQTIIGKSYLKWDIKVERREKNLTLVSVKYLPVRTRDLFSSTLVTVTCNNIYIYIYIYIYIFHTTIYHFCRLLIEIFNSLPRNNDTNLIRPSIYLIK